jgi:hypothetical protein
MENESGIMVANGLGQKLNKAITMVYILFPINATVQNGKSW